SSFAFEIAKNGTFYFTNNDLTANEISLYVSKDKLKTIKKIPIFNIYGISSIFSDVNNNIYLNSYNGIYISIDEGETFELYDKSLKLASNYTYYFSPNDNLFAFDTYTDHKIFEYYKKLSAFGLLNGTVYSDSNNDCIMQSQESIFPGTAVNLTGLITQKKFTDQDGKFKFRADEGNNSITAVPPNDLWEACPPTNINILPNQTGSINVDLGLKIKKVCPYLTLDIQAPIMRRCFDNLIYIKYCNEGTDTSFNAQLKLTLPAKMTFLSSTLNPGSVNGSELNFDLGDLAIGECGQIILSAKLSCDAVIDELICIYGELSPNYSCSGGLIDLSDVRKCVKTTSSKDPNDKTAFIKGIPANGKSDMNQDVEYLIRFQNTGTDTAFRVEVIDIIPEGFDVNSLKIINSSHPFNIKLIGERGFKFVFDPIALPDSNINEPASHGFIAFRISQLKDLPYGTNLNNYADIYFDFNPSVRTNTDYIVLTELTNTTEIKENLQFSYFPNPTKGDMNIKLPEYRSQNYTLKVSDVFGKELIKESWNASSLNINLKPAILPGIYFISVEDESGRKGYGKFVVD
ncbi:MAG TPA: T9SS type A sorting domain-containing protein, partial [Saprospiraceae bacterium]|nr:T9SS type A sorting domain-containing protein [Saprospiraceae bacterium]